MEPQAKVRHSVTFWALFALASNRFFTTKNTFPRGIWVLLGEYGPSHPSPRSLDLERLPECTDLRSVSRTAEPILTILHLAHQRQLDEIDTELMFYKSDHGDAGTPIDPMKL